MTNADRKFNPRDHAGKIILAAPLFAVAIAFGVGAGVNWFAERAGGGSSARSPWRSRSSRASSP